MVKKQVKFKILIKLYHHILFFTKNLRRVRCFLINLYIVSSIVHNALEPSGIKPQSILSYSSNL